MKYLILITSVLLLTSAKSCNAPEIKGDVFARVYPSKNLARLRTIQNTCPTQLSQVTMVAITDLEDAGCWIPPEACARYEREYSQNACK